MSQRSAVLQRLLDGTPDGHHLEIDIQSGHCYAISVINGKEDTIAVLEGADLDIKLADAGTRVCKGKENGAYAWPMNGRRK